MHALMQLRRDLGEPELEDDYDAPPPWEGWTDWDFRAYMEKRRAAETQHADWLARQAAVGAHAHLNVSPLTDSRLRQNWQHLTGREPHRPTHAEFMDVSRACRALLDLFSPFALEECPAC